MTTMPDRETIFALLYPPIDIPRDAVDDDTFRDLTSPVAEIVTDLNVAVYVYVNDVDETDYFIVRETIVHDERPEPLVIEHTTYYTFPPRYVYEQLAPEDNDLSSACRKNMRDVLIFIASQLPTYDEELAAFC